VLVTRACHLSLRRALASPLRPSDVVLVRELGRPLVADDVAAVLGVDVVVREGLREFGVGVHVGTAGDPDPFRPTFTRWLAGDLEARIEGAESGTEVVDRMSTELELVADQHRGESALVVSHGGAICTAVPALARNLRPRLPETRAIPHTGVVALEADGDGWRALSWCGEAV
jgi:probable phosphoglycerate mutase